MDWSSLEDYLQAGNALWYGENQMVNHGQDKVALMTSEADPMGFERADSNGMPIQAELEPCLCIAFSAGVCGPSLEGCASPCEEMPSVLPGDPSTDLQPMFMILNSQHSMTKFGVPIHGEWCGAGHPGPGKVPLPIDELDDCCKKHDKCMDRHGCNNLCWWKLKCSCSQCDLNLAMCASMVDCSTSPRRAECEFWRPIIMLTMLALASRGCILPW